MMNPVLAITFSLGLACLSGCQSVVPWLTSAEPVVPRPTLAEPVVPRPTLAEPAAQMPPLTPSLVEKRETLTATGYSVISAQNHRNPAQQRLLAIRAAKLDAYRSLTEQVYGLELNATTTVADMTVQSDTFRSRVEGVIYGAKLVSISPAGDDTYETTLSLDKAVVQELRMLYLSQVASKGR